MDGEELTMCGDFDRMPEQPPEELTEKPATKEK